MRPIPDELLHGPFTRTMARAVHVSDRMLEGRRFVRVLPRVWRHRDHVMTDDDWATAARHALPEDAHLTGITRLQQLGLDHGPRLPVRFVIARDHHLRHDEVFLHRTVRLPPTDDVGVTPAAAYLACCARERVIDAIKVGDWLLFHGHTTRDLVRDLALAAPWRAGASEALWVLDHLDERSRSMPESETRAVLVFAGLPVPDANFGLALEEDLKIVPDLAYRGWRVVVEYDGAHHQEDREQYGIDIDRYAALRRSPWSYVQVTKEKLRQPRSVVGEVHRALRDHGYDGPPPEFGELWRQLFRPLSAVVGPRYVPRPAAGER